MAVAHTMCSLQVLMPTGHRIRFTPKCWLIYSLRAFVELPMAIEPVRENPTCLEP